MKLEQLKINIRPRNKWEAADLGMLLVQQWWRHLYTTWILITLPLFILLLLLLPNTTYAMLVFWWLKPLFERLHLYILSQAILGKQPTPGVSLNKFPALLKTQWFASITWRRFSPTRSMDLPVMQLENLAGKQRMKRLSLLHRQGGRAAFWLTIVCMHLESFLLIGLGVLFLLFIPEQYQPDIQWFFGSLNAELQIPYALLYWFSITLVSPYYVAAGFCIYLNRRVHLEAWDIELAFRQIRKEIDGTISSPPPLASAASVLAALLLVCTFSFPPPTQADEPLNYDRVSAVQNIERILAQEEFHQIEVRRQLKKQQGKQSGNDNFKFPDWISLLAKAAEFLLWASLVFVILYLLLQLRNRRLDFSALKNSAADTAAATLFGFDVREDSLPDDLLQISQKLWRQQKFRQAFSLLYRGSLSKLISRFQVPFTDDQTENECVTLSRRYVSHSVFSCFQNMTACWIHIAYGRHRISDAQFDEYCQSWQQHFAPEAVAGETYNES